MTAESVCPQCGGSGWRIIERDGISAADRCSCAEAERAARMEERSGIPPNYAFASFENFRAEGGLGKVLLDVKVFVREFGPIAKKPGLLLVGNPGTGKTHLAVAAARGLMAKGYDVRFFDYQELFERIRSGYDAASGTSDREAYRQALDADVLVLDDLGARRYSEWVEDTINGIITYRCNNQKPLIATTNVQYKAKLPSADRDRNERIDYRKSLIEIVGERAYSRLHEMCKVIEMPAVNDYRLGLR